VHQLVIKNNLILTTVRQKKPADTRFGISASQHHALDLLK